MMAEGRTIWSDGKFRLVLTRTFASVFLGAIQTITTSYTYGLDDETICIKKQM